MEFAFTADEQAFREDIRQFLRDHPPEQFAHEGMDAGYGSGAHSHAFLRQLGTHGWLSMCWPREYGGQERPFMYKLILLEELAAAGAPFGPLGGVDQVSESIIRYGSERLKQDLLPRAARGDITFWQGFSFL
jgi:alkylation response protein AidB-like acyl-CoA dehydrogenase